MGRYWNGLIYLNYTIILLKEYEIQAQVFMGPFYWIDFKIKFELKSNNDILLLKL